MTTKTTTPAPMITLKASELRNLTAPILPLAGTDVGLPALCTVLLEVRGNYVTATATDRFRVGVMRVRSGLADETDDAKPVEQSPNFRALVPVRDLKRVLTVFKPARWDNPTLTLTVRDDKLEVTQAGYLDGLTGTSLRIILETAEYPAVQSLLAKALKHDGERAQTSTVNPKYLADFRYAQVDGWPLVMRPTEPTKPILVTCGPHFIGLIMPIRTVGDQADWDAEWCTFLEPAAEPEKPAAKTTTKTTTRKTRGKAGAAA